MRIVVDINQAAECMSHIRRGSLKTPAYGKVAGTDEVETPSRREESFVPDRNRNRVCTPGHSDGQCKNRFGAGRYAMEQTVSRRAGS